MATTTVTRAGSGAWVKIAFAMFAVGWGASQFSPMLIVYRRELRLGASSAARPPQNGNLPDNPNPTGHQNPPDHRNPQAGRRPQCAPGGSG